jgi:hypothetical protein
MNHLLGKKSEYRIQNPESRIQNPESRILCYEVSAYCANRTHSSLDSLPPNHFQVITNIGIDRIAHNKRANGSSLPQSTEEAKAKNKTASRIQRKIIFPTCQFLIAIESPSNLNRRFEKMALSCLKCFSNHLFSITALLRACCFDSSELFRKECQSGGYRIYFVTIYSCCSFQAIVTK